MHLRNHSFRSSCRHYIKNAEVTKKASEVSINIGRVNSGYFASLFGVSNTNVNISWKGNSTSLDLNKVVKNCWKTIKNNNKDMEEWRRQERSVYIPAAINKSIDTAAGYLGAKVSTETKDRVFDRTFQYRYMSAEFSGVSNVKSAAQTSIGQTVGNYLSRNNSLDNLFKNNELGRDASQPDMKRKIREEHSLVSAEVTNFISDQIYKKYFSQDVSAIRKVALQLTLEETGMFKAKKIMPPRV
ncbi:hypothetical protein PL78_18085 [Yersinia entomophaga]|uniref:Uncharacterized protein n=1 Tax=Yersinia entomophaga TaxID=935293 RepID=A0ABM6BQG7_YERET|nr:MULTISPECIES: hypothetical protein [Yersinia]ANI31717.1 hypothetical protein PL78_18085 [Yersinia entomophaga]OWF84994.1 hypothetical protein B4914_18160 [Yersinia entomophaga]